MTDNLPYRSRDESETNRDDDGEEEEGDVDETVSPATESSRMKIVLRARAALYCTLAKDIT